jgi:hypothetical protein
VALATAAQTPSGEFPTAAEQDLLDQVPDEVRDSCARTSVVPTLAGEEGFRLPIVAGLECPIAGTAAVQIARYWSIPERVGRIGGGSLTKELLFFNVVGDNQIPEGDCASQPKAHGEWDLGGLLSGDVLCYPVGSQAHMVWIYDDYDIYARARRDDGDHAALYDWWESTGRVIER